MSRNTERVEGQALLKGKVLVVLGASGPIGSQAAFKWALAGATLIAIGTCSYTLQQLQREVEDIGGRCQTICTSLDSQEAMEAVVKAIAHLDQPLDAFINLVGEYGFAPLSCPRWLLSQPSLPVGENWGRQVYYHCLGKGQRDPGTEQRVIAPSSTPIPVIDVICLRSEDASPIGLAPAIRENIPHVKPISLPPYPLLPTPALTLYLWETDKERTPAAPTTHLPDPTSLTWTGEAPVLVSPALMVDQTIALLTEGTPQGINEVLIQATPSDVMQYFLTQPEEKMVLATAPERIADPLRVVVQTTALGRGVFARQDFATGDLILRTTGCVLQHQTEHSIQIDWHRHLEPDPPIRLINHSCEPNAGIKTNAAGLPDFYARRPIRSGEEITFDYAMSEFNHQTRDNPDLEFDLVCRCGAATCRGKLGYYSELPDSLRSAYQEFLSAYLLSLTDARLS